MQRAGRLGVNVKQPTGTLEVRAPPSEAQVLLALSSATTSPAATAASSARRLLGAPPSPSPSPTPASQVLTFGEHSVGGAQRVTASLRADHLGSFSINASRDLLLNPTGLLLLAQGASARVGVGVSAAETSMAYIGGLGYAGPKVHVVGDSLLQGRITLARARPSVSSSAGGTRSFPVNATFALAPTGELRLNAPLSTKSHLVDDVWSSWLRHLWPVKLPLF